MEEMERDYILEVLEAQHWKVGGENSASAVLNMPASTLRSRMNKLNIRRP
jgi:formate hydrogenlyase transcriptional activator